MADYDDPDVIPILADLIDDTDMYISGSVNRKLSGSKDKRVQDIIVTKTKHGYAKDSSSNDGSCRIGDSKIMAGMVKLLAESEDPEYYSRIS